MEPKVMEVLPLQDTCVFENSTGVVPDWQTLCTATTIGQLREGGVA